MAGKGVPEMTYFVSSVMLSINQSITEDTRMRVWDEMSFAKLHSLRVRHSYTHASSSRGTGRAGQCLWAQWNVGECLCQSGHYSAGVGHDDWRRAAQSWWSQTDGHRCYFAHC